jgi:hypothetical protein
MARLRHADERCECLFIGADWKSMRCDDQPCAFPDRAFRSVFRQELEYGGGAGGCWRRQVNSHSLLLCLAKTVIPRASRIQYDAAFQFHHCRFGLLDRPLSRAMTAGGMGYSVLRAGNRDLWCVSPAVTPL